jgi:hypothetical protein
MTKNKNKNKKLKKENKANNKNNRNNKKIKLLSIDLKYHVNKKKTKRKNDEIFVLKNKDSMIKYIYYRKDKNQFKLKQFLLIFNEIIRHFK